MEAEALGGLSQREAQNELDRGWPEPQVETHIVYAMAENIYTSLYIKYKIQKII